MPTLVDAFNTDIFSMLELTSAINKMPFVPGQVGATGIFNSVGVPTTQVMVEERDGYLALIANHIRGQEPEEQPTRKRTARSFIVPHFPTHSRIMADEIQDVRLFGSANVMEALASKRDEKLADQIPSHEATLEWGRIGALKGQLLDADGSTVIYDWFTEFGVTQLTQAMALDVATTNVRGLINEAQRQSEGILGAQPTQSYIAFCGNSFFDSFINHDNVEKAYANWSAAEQLTRDIRYSGFQFVNTLWYNYRGSVSGNLFVADAEAYLVPVGPMLYQTRFAPANYMETVNTMGLPRTVKATMDQKGRWMDIDVQSNPISYVTRPDAVIKLTET